jgi:hypothetical protein
MDEIEKLRDANAHHAADTKHIRRLGASRAKAGIGRSQEES